VVALWVSLITSACTQKEPAAKQLVQVSYLHAAPLLGVVVDNEMKVVDIDAGGVAEKAGIQRGDILKSLDGVAFNTDGQEIKEVLDQKIPALGGQLDDDMRIIGIETGVSQPTSPLPTVQDESLAQGSMIKETLQPPGKPTVLLKLRRGDQDLQLEVELFYGSSGFPGGTPTPLWPDQGLFYY